MTGQIETTVAKQHSSRWQKLQAWITAMDEGMNYDPLEHANGRITHLWQKVEQLETRLSELEGRDKRAA